MGSIFKPKMPALPPVQPPPEPPEPELSDEEKAKIKKNKTLSKEEEEVVSQQYLLDHLVFKKQKKKH